MNTKHKKINKIMSFKDSLGRVWIGCRYCEKMQQCYPGCEKKGIDGFCMKGILRKKGEND